MARRTDYKELAKRLELKAFLPSEDAERIAGDRTEDLVLYFETAVSHCSWMRANEMLRALCRSAYLQGVTDAAQAMALRERGSGVAIGGPPEGLSGAPTNPATI
jgi:hypothetical protein